MNWILAARWFSFVGLVFLTIGAGVNLLLAYGER